MGFATIQQHVDQINKSNRLEYGDNGYLTLYQTVDGYRVTRTVIARTYPTVSPMNMSEDAALDFVLNIKE